jgi:hypothetical protein
VWASLHSATFSTARDSSEPCPRLGACPLGGIARPGMTFALFFWEKKQ